MPFSNRVVTDEQLKQLMVRELGLYEQRTPKSRKAFIEAQDVLLNGVPMPWMGDWGTSYPLFVQEASGNRIIDLDGHEYVDFCLGIPGPCSVIRRKPQPGPWLSR